MISSLLVCLFISKMYSTEFHKTWWRDGTWTKKLNPDKGAGSEIIYHFLQYLHFTHISEGIIHDSSWKKNKRSTILVC